MNRFESNFGAGGEARLRYLQNDYTVVRSGRSVLCALSGARIPLEDLRYWNADLQEAYATPEIATRRYLEGSGGG